MSFIILNIIFGAEKYLLYCQNNTYRSNICRLRISCHKLLIETGRHMKLKPEDRICKHCNLNEVEDEVHFLTKCKLYTNERKNFLDKIKAIFQIEHLNSQELFSFIINNHDKNVIQALGYFITQCFKKRLT